MLIHLSELGVGTKLTQLHAIIHYKYTVSKN